MSAITQCPQCNTRFKVSQAQLDAHQGLVRCGLCQAVFDATQHFFDDQPSLQLDLPITPDETQQALAGITAQPAHAENLTEIESSGEATGTITLAQQIASMEPPLAATPAPIAKKRHWPWVIGCLLLLVVLLAQAAFFFRIELAARLPGLKPALVSYCMLLQCTVPLPQKADQLSIESSDLEAADPAQASIITLNATLRNHAPYAQAYPNLELTLTDTQDKALARRTFHPAEYLKPGEDEQKGLAPSRELNVKLHLDTTDIKPSGYRLFLFYPQ